MLRSFFVAIVVLGLAVASSFASGWGAPAKPPCPPGYTLVEEICYKDVTKKVVHPVRDFRKVPRWVYSNRPVDFALPTCDSPDGCCDGGCCAHCGKPCVKAPLIKHLVYDYVPITKCEVECTVERVPYKVYRKVPCGQVHGGVVVPALPVVPTPPGAPTLPGAPAAPGAEPEPLPVQPVPMMPRAPISAPRGGEVFYELQQQ